MRQLTRLVSPIQHHSHEIPDLALNKSWRMRDSSKVGDVGGTLAARLSCVQGAKVMLRRCAIKSHSSRRAIKRYQLTAMLVCTSDV